LTRVIAKAEWLPGATPEDGKANPRFVVTSLKRARADARHVYQAGTNEPCIFVA